MDRRDFLKASSGLAFSLLAIEEAVGQEERKAINAWVRLAPDGTVTIYSAGAEMGQGSMTSLALIVAEEMDADWSKVKVEFAPADAEVYGYTWAPTNSKMMSIVGS